MDLGHYILVGRTPILVDLMTWAQWMNDFEKRLVALTTTDRFRVSTVFLGLDMNWSRSGDPVLFETMIFGGPLNEETWRYATYAEAERGHEHAVTQARIADAKVKAIADAAGAG
jgi:hypothetical protein